MKLSVSICVIGSLICNQNDKLCHIDDLIFTVQGYTRSMRKLQNSNSSSAEVCWGALGRNCSIDFFPDAKHLSAVEKYAFTDILSEAAWSCTCIAA